MADLGTWANMAEIASLAAIVIAGGFAVYQLRAERLARQDAAAFALIQKFMDDPKFVAAARYVLESPSGWHKKALSPQAMEHLDRIHMTLETIGFAVHRGVVRIEDVEGLMGGVTREVYAALEPFIAQERKRSPRWYEWSQWLVEQLEACPAGSPSRGSQT